MINNRPKVPREALDVVFESPQSSRKRAVATALSAKPTRERRRPPQPAHLHAVRIRGPFTLPLAPGDTSQRTNGFARERAVWRLSRAPFGSPRATRRTGATD